MSTESTKASRYRLHRDSDDGDWIARPNNGGDVGDLQDICDELNKLRAALEGLMPIFVGKYLSEDERKVVTAARDILENTQITDA